VVTAMDHHPTTQPPSKRNDNVTVTFFIFFA
jgi:hypothetical protein